MKKRRFREKKSIDWMKLNNAKKMKALRQIKEKKDKKVELLKLKKIAN